MANRKRRIARTSLATLGLLVISVLVALGIPGDVNNDGVLNVIDARICLQVALGFLQPTSAQLSACDVNGDGQATLADAQQIARTAITALLATPVTMTDDFTASNGAAPNPVLWDSWIAPDMGNVTLEIQNNELRAYCVYATALGDLGSLGCGLKTKDAFTATSFDVQVTYLRTNGPGFGYGYFSVLPDSGQTPIDMLVGMDWNVGGGWEAFVNPTPGAPGSVFQVICGTTTQGLLNMSQSHTFRMVGSPGDKISYYIDAVLRCETFWNPSISTFKVGFAGRPGGTVGEWRETFFDNFSLVYTTH